ncbi:unnamed protein product [Symbiodinium natans]|uniref:Uncharacterized protein n=1 Tax=Symbiodinium natans TaxID=878477 RepID=A0A812JTT3_9DINO|nr:unnamed protein product [Symbiodinium natans]
MGWGLAADLPAEVVAGLGARSTCRIWCQKFRCYVMGAAAAINMCKGWQTATCRSLTRSPILRKQGETWMIQLSNRIGTKSTMPCPEAQLDSPSRPPGRHKQQCLYGCCVYREGLFCQESILGQNASLQIVCPEY